MRYLGGMMEKLISQKILAILILVGLFGIMTNNTNHVTGRSITLQPGNFETAQTATITPKEVILTAANPTQKLDFSVLDRRFVWHIYYVTSVDNLGRFLFEPQEFIPLEKTFQKSGWIIGNAGQPNGEAKVSTEVTVDWTKTLSSNNFVFAYTCQDVFGKFECNNNKWSYAEFKAKTIDLRIDISSSESVVGGSPIDITFTISTTNPNGKSLDPGFNLSIDWDSLSSTKSVISADDLVNAKSALKNYLTLAEFSLSDLKAEPIVKKYRVAYNGQVANPVIKASIELGNPNTPQFEDIDILNNVNTKQIKVEPAPNYYISSIGNAGGDVLGTANIPITISRENGIADDQNEIEIILDFQSALKNANVNSASLMQGTTSQPLNLNGEGYYTAKYKFGTKKTDALNFLVGYKAAGVYSIKANIAVQDQKLGDNEIVGVDKVTMTSAVGQTAGQTAQTQTSSNVQSTSTPVTQTSTTDSSSQTTSTATQTSTTDQSQTSTSVTQTNTAVTSSQTANTQATSTPTNTPQQTQPATTPICGNGIKDGLETDVDCGGDCTTKCWNGKGCTTNADCISLYCFEGNCKLPSVVSAGLIGYWKFDEETGTTAIDSAGNNNGLIKNNPTSVLGISGKALLFSGTNYVEISSAGLLDGKSTGWTVDAWAKVSGVTNDGWGCELGQTNVPIASALRYSLYTTAYKQLFDPIKEQNSVAITAESDFIINWHHYAGTFSKENGKRVYKIYVDGKLKNQYSETESSIPEYPSSKLIIAGTAECSKGSPNPETFGKGIIDEVKVYNRALSETEVMQNCKSTGKC